MSYILNGPDPANPEWIILYQDLTVDLYVLTL